MIIACQASAMPLCLGSTPHYPKVIVTMTGVMLRQTIIIITNPDVPADCFDAFHSDEDASDPIDHAIFECSAYATTRQMFSDLFPSHVSTVSQFLDQPDCNRLAKFLTWIRMLRLNTA